MSTPQHSPTDPALPTALVLARRYAAASEEAEQLARGVAPGDLIGRMRAAVDAIWTHLATAEVSWVGFYLPVAPPSAGAAEQLVLGPSRNKPACSPIGLHGVCGQAYRSQTVQIVGDVRALGAEYIACDPRDRSEVVIPIYSSPGAPKSDGARCIGVLDVDSYLPNRFGPADVDGLRRVLAAVGLNAS